VARNPETPDTRTLTEIELEQFFADPALYPEAVITIHGVVVSTAP
jgi:hypothetical protein